MGRNVRHIDIRESLTKQCKIMGNCLDNYLKTEKIRLKYVRNHQEDMMAFKYNAIIDDIGRDMM